MLEKAPIRSLQKQAQCCHEVLGGGCPEWELDGTPLASTLLAVIGEEEKSLLDSNPYTLCAAECHLI